MDAHIGGGFTNYKVTHCAQSVRIFNSQITQKCGMSLEGYLEFLQYTAWTVIGLCGVYAVAAVADAINPLSVSAARVCPRTRD